MDLQYPGQNKIYGSQTLSTPQNFPVPPASGDFSFGLTQQQQSGDCHNLTTTPWTSAESKNVIGYGSHTQNSVEFGQHLGHRPQTPPNFPVPPAREVSSFGLTQPFTASTLQQPSEPADHHHYHGFPLSAFSTESLIEQSGHYHSSLFLESQHVTLTHSYTQVDYTTTTTLVSISTQSTGEPAMYHYGELCTSA